MSLSEKLTALNTAKQNMKTVLTNQGYDMSTIPFTDYYKLLRGDYGLPVCDYYVSPNGLDTNMGTSVETPFLTLSKAITTATDGKTIGVLAGTYTGTSNCDLTISKNLSIIGTSGTIFDGESTRRSGWTLNGVVDVNGITFKNGSTSTNGGAINNVSSGIISNCIFNDNTSVSYGGAIYNHKGNVNNCTFKGNISNNGGAIINRLVNAEYVNSVYNCDFLATTSTNIYNYVNGILIDGCYWNTSTPTTSSYNSTLNDTVPTNDRTTPNHPERLV